MTTTIAIYPDDLDAWLQRHPEVGHEASRANDELHEFIGDTIPQITVDLRPWFGPHHPVRLAEPQIWFARRGGPLEGIPATIMIGRRCYGDYAVPAPAWFCHVYRRCVGTWAGIWDRTLPMSIREAIPHAALDAQLMGRP